MYKYMNRVNKVIFSVYRPLFYEESSVADYECD